MFSEGGVLRGSAVIEAVSLFLDEVEADGNTDEAAPEFDPEVPTGGENQEGDAEGDADQIDFAAPEYDFFGAFGLEEVEIVGLDLNFN